MNNVDILSDETEAHVVCLVAVSAFFIDFIHIDVIDFVSAVSQEFVNILSNNIVKSREFGMNICGGGRPLSRTH